LDLLLFALQIVLVKQRPHLRAAFLVDHSADELVGLDNFLDFVGRVSRFQGCDRQITLARLKQR
jgi:hypothetical protein